MKNFSAVRELPALENMEKLRLKLEAVEQEISKAVIGQERVVRLTLAAIMAGGHVMIVGVPGLAKTRLVEALGITLGLDMKRIQFTPDLMPADITGGEVMETDADGKRFFRFIKGPVFAQLLMADEINRASPRTQSALLQAMQEHKVTIAGVDYPLPSPFAVVATRNPIEQEGTYPLPEAQADRFLSEIEISYPSEAAELKIITTTTTAQEISLKQIMQADEVNMLRSMVREIPMGEKLAADIVKIVRETRPETSHIDEVKKYVILGAGSRAAQALSLASRALCLMKNRSIPLLEDVIELLESVLRHRLILNYSARGDGVRTADIVEAILRKAL